MCTPITNSASTSEELEASEALVRAELGRAHNRIRALTEESRRFERSVRAQSKEIQSLQSVIARLKDERSGLERHVEDLVRESEALRIANCRHFKHNNALVRSLNRLQNEQYWSICHFIACSTDFDAYAKSVGYSVSRLFGMLLAAELRQASDVSAELQAHASALEFIFDPVFYLTEYKDVALQGVNPLLHYVTIGFRQKRNPTRLFDCAYYGTQVRLNNQDPLLHYLQKGSLANLKPHPLFDGKYYLEQNADVASLQANPLVHYQVWGSREKRDPSPLFDTKYFLELWDPPHAVENPLAEYLMGNAGASISPHPLFHTDYFREVAGIDDVSEPPLVIYEMREDLWKVQPHPLLSLDYITKTLGIRFAEGVSPLESFCRMSRDQDIDPSILFDSKLYRYQIEHERRSELSEPPIIDYLKRGYKDKTLLPNILFDPEVYIGRNQIKVDGPELTHYCLYGDRAGLFTHLFMNTKFYNSQRTDKIEDCTALGHFFSSGPSNVHMSHEHISEPILPDVLGFIKQIYSDKEDFDARFYRQVYPDLASLSEADARHHYFTDGKMEGRVASPRMLVDKFNLLIRDIPLGFFPKEYVHFNPDVAGLGTEFIPLFGHYIEWGRAENRTIGKWQFYLNSFDLKVPTPASPISVNIDSERIEVGVLMHIFYPDLLPELAAFARNFSAVSRDIFINVVDIGWSSTFHRQLRELCPGAFVQLSNDNGRDIGGFVRLLDNVDIEKYEFFAWMHSKKSPHIAAEKGEYWRRSLLGAFAGSQEIAAECVRLFKEDASVGLVAAREWRSTYMGNNRGQYERALELFGIDEKHREIEYVSGTMFLMRSEIVQRLYNTLKSLEWEYGGDKDIEFHRDGQIAHAVERVIGNLVRQMGYRIAWR